MERVGALILRLADAREPDPARREQALLLDALIGSIALRSMMPVVDAGHPFRIKDLVETGVLAPASFEIAEWALRLLERFGAAAEAGSEWRIEATTDLPDTEEVWRLPETRLCFTRPELDVPVSAPPALSAGHITFGCFSSHTKVGDAVLQAWGRVLAAVPTSRERLRCRPAVRCATGDRGELAPRPAAADP